jgi:hypothetical protein
MLDHPLALRPLAASVLLLTALPFAGCSGGSTSAGTSGSTNQGGQGGAPSSTTTSVSGTTGQGGAGGSGVLQDGQCRTQMDCQKSGVPCVAPGTFLGCGACMNVTSTCQTDGECTANGPLYICEPLPCVCQGPANACVMGCMDDTPCAQGQVCSAAHRCEVKPCQSITDCPANFICGASPAQCVRKPCAADAECKGTCVLGACYDTPGTCQAPPP